MDPVFLSSLFAVGAAAGTRSAGTLLALGLFARFAPAFFTLSPELGALTHPGVLAVLGALLVLESLAERDEGLAEVLVSLRFVLRTAAGAVAGLALVGGPEALEGWVGLGLGGIAAFGVQTLRFFVHRLLVDLGSEVMNPRRWLLHLEEGGVLGLVAAVILAPAIAAGVVIFGLAAGLGALLFARRLEDRGRRACPACSGRIRKEASRCPRCAAEVRPEVLLSP